MSGPVFTSRAQVFIPVEYVTQIIQNTVEESAVLRLARRVPMGAGIQKMPVLAALPSVAWISPRDTGQKAATSAEWDDVTLEAEEIAAIVPVPEAVIADATYDIFGELRPRISEALGAAIDLAVMFGEAPPGSTNFPSSFPVGGLVAHATAAGNVHQAGTAAPLPGATAAGDLAEDFNETFALVEDDGFVPNGTAVRPNLRSRLRGLRTTTGEMLYVPALTAAMPEQLFGQPLTYNRNGAWDPTQADALTGDWSKSVIGIRQDMTARVLTEATLTDGAGKVLISLAEQDMVALRVVMRIGVAIANPVTRLQPTKADRSPFAVMTPAAGGGGGPRIRTRDSKGVTAADSRGATA